MPKKFATVEDRRAYWREWYSRNKHRSDYKTKDKATKKRIRKERSNWWVEYRKTLRCERCGIADYRVLDFHHLDPEQKDIEVSNLVARAASKQKIFSEIEKCKCLCANCHRIVHWEEKNIEHKV
jgi:hypothetical protein